MNNKQDERRETSRPITKLCGKSDPILYGHLYHGHGKGEEFYPLNVEHAVDENVSVWNNNSAPENIKARIYNRHKPLSNGRLNKKLQKINPILIVSSSHHVVPSYIVTL